MLHNLKKLANLARVSKSGITFVRYVGRKVKDNEALLDAAYSDVEKSNILECFNKCSETELMYTKYLNRIKASAIVDYRNKKGDFETVSSLLSVPGIGVLSLQRLCSILKEKDHETLQKLKDLESIESVRSYPYLTESQCEAVESIVSLDLHSDRVSWVKMNRDMEVEMWQQSILFDKPYTRFDHVLYLNQVHEFVKSLPECSIFTMENKQYRVPSLRVMPLVVNMKCLETMMLTVLNNDYSTSKIQRVHLIKPTVISRYFKLLVGGERVSGQHIVRDVINHQSEYVDDVYISKSLTDNYFKHDSIQQEKLSNCLLQAIAFLKLIVLKDDRLTH